MLLGEGPGHNEERQGRGFVGKSGQLLFGMLKPYGIERANCRLDNLSLYRLTDAKGDDRAPTEAEFEDMAPALIERVMQVRPDLIITLGRFSTRALLDRPIAMEVANGQLYEWVWGHVLPVVHPAAGLHQPEMLTATYYGLQQVGRFLREGPWPAVQAPPAPEYYEAKLQPARPPVLGSLCSIDTEGVPGRELCVQVSTRSGFAWLIRASDKLGLEALALALRRDRPTVLLHGALWDLRILKVLGIDLLAWGLTVRDTMIESFLTQVHPRGLKPLAERLLGVQMRSYEDVVEPTENRFVTEYIERALANPAADWCVGEGKKHSVVKRLYGVITPGKPDKEGVVKSAREKWHEKDRRWLRELVEQAHGPTPTPGYEDMPQPDFLDYACRDADVTGGVGQILDAEIQRLDLRRVHAIDHGAIPLVARMQEVGLTVDMQALDELRDFIREEKAAAVDVCRALTMIDDLNPGSGDQVAAFCRAQKLGLTKLTKGRTREKVDENELTLIRFKHPAIEAILTYRELDKLEGTYVEPLYGFVVGTGRYRKLHPRFKLTSAITGRLACEDPNLLAFPARTELGRRIRALFVAGEGRRLGSCDLSQIELRVGAGLAQDENMIQAFVDGVDLHTRTAAKFFHHDAQALGLVTKRERTVIKVPNFGIFFGAREHRMEQEFLIAGIEGYGLPECRAMIEWWFGEYPGVERWIAETQEQARRDGFVRTEAGRMRYLPALQFTQSEYPFSHLREEAERQCSNYPVQGTAAEKLKNALPVVQEVLAEAREQGYYAEPLLLVHDELLTEFDEDTEPYLREALPAAMTHESPWRGVPLEASWSSGPTWASLK